MTIRPETVLEVAVAALFSLSSLYAVHSLMRFDKNLTNLPERHDSDLDLFQGTIGVIK